MVGTNKDRSLSMSVNADIGNSSPAGLFFEMRESAAPNELGQIAAATVGSSAAWARHYPTRSWANSSGGRTVRKETNSARSYAAFKSAPTMSGALRPAQLIDRPARAGPTAQPT